MQKDVVLSNTPSNMNVLLLTEMTQHLHLKKEIFFSLAFRIMEKDLVIHTIMRISKGSKRKKLTELLMHEGTFMYLTSSYLF